MSGRDAGLTVVRGAGDIATGVIVHFARCGRRVLALESARPTAIRRTVAFSDTVYHGTARVEEMTARRVEEEAQMRACWAAGEIPVAVDPQGEWIERLGPGVVIDAILAKRNLGTHRDASRVTVALGPGFTAGEDADAVIETQRGHRLGRVIYQGAALPNTGIPGEIAGVGSERVTHAPATGVLRGVRRIGDTVEKDEVLAYLDETPVRAKISGVLRGILPDGFFTPQGMKMLDIDPRIGEKENCATISDKARCIAGGALEAVMVLERKNDLPG